MCLFILRIWLCECSRFGTSVKKLYFRNRFGRCFYSESKAYIISHRAIANGFLFHSFSLRAIERNLGPHAQRWKEKSSICSFSSVISNRNEMERNRKKTVRLKKLAKKDCLRFMEHRKKKKYIDNNLQS